MALKRLGGTIVNNHVSVGAIAINKEVNHLVGTTSTVIEKPTDNYYSLFVVKVESGNFRVKTGDHTSNGTGDLSSFNTPSSTITDGSGGWILNEGETVSVQAVDEMTFIGDSADAILTYYFV